MRFTIIEPTDFLEFPVGGQLSFVRDLIRCYAPHEISLVGLTCDRTVPIGCWTTLKLDGREFDFFAVERRLRRPKQPIVPGRATFLLGLLRWRRRILERSGKYLFIQAPEAMIGLAQARDRNLCYCFPGVENPLSMSRYWYGKIAQKPFYAAFLNGVQHAQTVLASADDIAIEELKRRHPRLNQVRIQKFPTCVDTERFRPAGAMEKATLRMKLKLPMEARIVAFCGRLNAVKGWPLLIESFYEVLRQDPAVKLLIIGDGEDRAKLQSEVSARGMEEAVIITGFVAKKEVAEYLRVADLFAVCSIKEGWSIAMLEALAAGLPIVSTFVSGAVDMVVKGQNGLIVQDRDPRAYADAVLDVLEWPGAGQASEKLASAYGIKHLRGRFDRAWKRDLN